MLLPWPLHLRWFRLSQRHATSTQRQDICMQSFLDSQNLFFRKKRKKERMKKTTRIANSVWGVFCQLLNHIKYKLTASIPHYFVDVWSIGRLSLLNVFKSIYSLPLFFQLILYSQKTGSVKNNRQNRNNRSKGRQTFLLRTHRWHRLQWLQFSRLHKNNYGFVVIWQMFLLVTRYHIINMGILPTLLCYLYSLLCYISEGERSPTSAKRRSKPYMEKGWFIPRKPFKNWLACIARLTYTSIYTSR